MKNALVNLALAFYAGEPCRICGKPLTMEDINDGAVFAGYSKDNSSRSAHRLCWNKTTMESLKSKTIARIIDASSPQRGPGEYYTIVIVFTDGTYLTLNSGSQYCDDAWIEVEIGVETETA